MRASDVLTDAIHKCHQATNQQISVSALLTAVDMYSNEYCAEAPPTPGWDFLV